MNQVLKECLGCHQLKSFDAFSFDNRVKSGLQARCKKCNSSRNKQWVDKNPDKKRLSNINWCLNNREQDKNNKKEYYRKNKKKSDEDNKLWIANNYQQYKKYHRDYRKHKLKTDINYKILMCCRARINQTLNHNQKLGHTIDLLGVSIQQYNDVWLSSQFYNNMTWFTQGNDRNSWQIHHICPLEFFDMSNPIEQQQAFHYTNTKPLWYVDHCEEHRKINERMSQYDPKDIYPWKY